MPVGLMEEARGLADSLAVSETGHREGPAKLCDERNLY